METKKENNSEKKIINIVLDDSDNDSNQKEKEESGEGVENENEEERKKLNDAEHTTISKPFKYIQYENPSTVEPDPVVREKRAVVKKLEAGKKVAASFDEISFKAADMCDCLMKDCVGCHFPCVRCRSCKCGAECRNNRRWIYESVENEAQMTTITNSLLKPQT